MAFFQLKGGKTKHVHGLRGSADIFYLAEQKKKTLIITGDPNLIDDLMASYTAFRPEARVHALPPLDGTPFSFMPIHASTRRTRLLTLQALMTGEWDAIVTTPQVFLEVLPGPKHLLQPQLNLSVGQDYDLTGLTRDLDRMGYLVSDLVTQPGDFARRGGILDIYSFVNETAYRLEFFDDELEEIRIFDPSTQRGKTNLDDITILPLYEWCVGPEQSDSFSRKGGELWNKTEERGRFLELVAQIRDRGRFSGYLHWTGLFHASPFRFYDYLEGETLCYLRDWDGIQEAQEKFFEQMDLQEQALGWSEHSQTSRRLLFGLDDVRNIPLNDDVEVLQGHHLKPDRTDLDFVTQTVPAYHNDAIRMLQHWKPHANRLVVVVACRTTSVLKRFEELLDNDDFPVGVIKMPLEELRPGLYLTLANLHTGFSWPDRNIVFISERDVWSTHRRKRPARVSARKMFQAEFRDLKVGDFVVHLDHGIGRFLGLVEMEAGGTLHEMMALEYKDGQKLYVNLHQLDLVQRYGSESGHAQLDKLGGVSWKRTRSRVKKAVRQMAEQLIKLYAERQMVGGHSFGVDTEWQMEFEESFEHEPTEGQLTSISDIKADLESNRPMDRLLVGDVGFGKTEVSMRMAFKVVLEGFQVAVLCPTTVLAFQHYHTFKNRFSSFPVNIAWVSRFSSPKETKKALEDTASGAVDILIGTHRILSNDVRFNKLGALIIDEEQRFGVSHKEKLKNIRKQLDVLSMSATPIPRTLNLSMTGIRDISVIETPPRNRLAINTTVAEAREGLIKNAIEFELDRDGQVFFIHNRVESMETVINNLKKLVPRARFGMAHGQMEPKSIEKVMLAFMHRKVDVLVASTIIENGVDIPNANTMLVNRADMFGMSQLYQLRGRIGRSDRPAYAYLLVPQRARMTSMARKRLAALEEFSDLGSGFRIAAMDMELRGAGNMLGAEQAGHINAIGYETYIKLLAEAVDEMKGKKVEDNINTLIKLNIGAAIPRNYVADSNQRLHHYKKLAAAKTAEEVEEIRDTMRDLFGPLPGPAELLCCEHELRVFLSGARVLSAERDGSRLRLKFHEKAEVNSEVVLGWIQQRRDVVVNPDGLITVPLESRAANDILNSARATVEQLI